MEKTKVIDISTDMKKLRTILRKLPKEKKAVAEPLFKELEFMQRTLETLKNEVDEVGPTAMFKQGKQEFLRESPALKGYNTTIQRYALIYKQIISLLPKDDGKSTDELLDFIKK
ncbi:hypothetical protein [Clostridium tyrobutyricum]|uniref:hypothetical protein n=1 Tax=Clostridium tyrobutyricum TaxID=1519 RepID=UPI001C389C6D|nr:hypothetical protein [Clostridium tyrobutyricum]MBV4429057.1 hypothetical protein [Clostridium tyrobutyricum]MBV4444134.1 hypothetical protein [Clostridium tyrobutyricum]